jgi:flavin reductase (DIM6/NTAB) family NADH-FMN oxidoreductase RutF
MEKPAPVDPMVLRLAMRQWTTGVTIVSANFAGFQHGMTVSSFTSISLAPPAVLVTLEHTSRTHDLLVQSGHFGVTILSRRQQEVSERFAGRQTENEDRFANLPTFTLQTGAPFLAGGLAFFDCRVLDTRELGSNTLFIGEVLVAQPGAAGEALV